MPTSEFYDVGADPSVESVERTPTGLALHFTGANPLRDGMVLSGSVAGEPYLVRAMSVTERADGIVEVATEEASIGDAFESGHVIVHFRPDDDAALEDVGVRTDPLVDAFSSAGIGDLVSYSCDTRLAPAQLRPFIRGNMGEVDLEIRIAPPLFRLEFGAGFEMGVRLESSGACSCGLAVSPLDGIDVPLAVVPIGPIPVSLNLAPVFELRASVGSSREFTSELGLRATLEPGALRYATDRGFTSTFRAPTLAPLITMERSASFTTSLDLTVGARISARVAGLAGPFVQVDAVAGPRCQWDTIGCVETCSLGNVQGRVQVGGEFRVGPLRAEAGGAFSTDPLRFGEVTRSFPGCAAGADAGIPFDDAGALGMDGGGVPVSPPGAPIARTPADGGTAAQGVVGFAWDSVAGAARYHLMVCSSVRLDVGCINPDGGTVGVEPAAGLTTATVSLTAGAWYWAVRAIRAGDIGGWGPYGATRTLTVTPPPPTAPLLTAPAAGASVTEGSIAFSWGSSSSAARYHLMVCTSPTLTAGCLDTDGGGVGIEPAVGVRSAIVPLTTGAWHWAVRAIRAGDVGGWGAYSTIRTLTVTSSRPPAPTLIAPADAIVVAPGSTSFSWSSASGAARYHLMICSSPGLSSGCLNPDGGGVGIEPVPGVTNASVILAAGTWYWAARAIRAGDVGGWGDYSPTRSITASCTDLCIESYVSCAAEDRAQHCVRDGTGCLVWVPESDPCPAGYVCVAGPPGPGTACVNCGNTGDPCCAGGMCSGGRTCEADGRCGPGPCPAGQAYCSGCTDTSTNAGHCGACDNVCPARPNANARCVASTCTFVCGSPYDDCDGVAANGCETNLHDGVTDCGLCGRTCSAPASATPYCNLGICAWNCQSGYGDCDGSGTNGCETSLTTSVAHCSACGAACMLPNAIPACMASACAVVGCSSGFGDCDAIPANGCERDLRSDASHCGSCGLACGGAESCSMGSCVPTCGAPRMMCGASCIEVTTDPANCGTCGHVCPGADTCAAGICSSQRIVEVGGGRYHSCARRASGAVACWGNNGLGQLGDGTGVDSLVPVTVSGITDAIDLSVGYVTSCLVRAGGTVACWGENGYGRIGDGTTTMRLSPVAVSGLSGIVEVVTESLNTCARASSGQVYCWGDNSLGQLGDGTVSGTPRLTPAAVPGMTDATDLAVGEGFVCVRRSSGQVWCWGQNVYGELGSGTATAMPRPTPAAVAGISDAVEIAAGGHHACARRATGQVVCWGANDAGQLGVSTAAEDRSATPVIAGLPAGDAVELALGAGHSCARRSGGSVYCWGYNGYGQVGDGTLVNRTTPVVIPVGGFAAAIDLGEYHSCAARDTGALMCWGQNANGRLGDGTTTDSSLPVAVSGL